MSRDIPNEDQTIGRILRHYNDLPFRVFREATPVQVLTAFHHLILKIHADLGFNFSTVNARTHDRFAKSMKAIGLEAWTPSLTSITRVDKTVLMHAFNALIDIFDPRSNRQSEGSSAVPEPNPPETLAALPRPRTKRMSIATSSLRPAALGLPKPRTKRLSMATGSSLQPGLGSPTSLLTPRRPSTLIAPLRRSNLSATPLRNSLSSSTLTAPLSRSVNGLPIKYSTPVKSVRPTGLTALSSKISTPAVQHTPPQVTPRTIKARLSLLPKNTPPKIPSLRQPRKPRPSVAPLITPATLPEGFDTIENPFKTKAKLMSTPVASRASASRSEEKPTVLPLKLIESDTEAFTTKHKIARTPEPTSTNSRSRSEKASKQNDAPTVTSQTNSSSGRTENPVQLPSLYKRFLITDDDDNLPLRTIRKLIQAQKAADKNGDAESEETPKSDSKSRLKKNGEMCASDDKENQAAVKPNRKKKKSLVKKPAKNSPLTEMSEKRPSRRAKKPPISDIYDDNSEDDLVREASALLQRCELSDDEQSRKRAVNGRKLMEAIVTIRKSVAPRRRRK